MKKIKFFGLFVAGTLVLSCNNDDALSNNQETKLLPVKIVSKYQNEDSTIDEYIDDFQYDNENKLVKLIETSIESRYNGKLEYTFEYNGTEVTKIKQVHSYTFDGENPQTYSYTYTFAKTGNQIVVIETDQDNDVDNYNLEINDKGYIIADEDYKYTYDAKGNLIKRLSDFSDETFTYDDKNGVLKNMNLPQWLIEKVLGSYTNMYINNPVDMSYKDLEDPKYNENIKIKYQYNAQGYPVSAEMVGNSMNTVTIQYK